jgi:preprotein translocase subunit SecB
MYPSPLLLDRHFFSKVEINSNVDGDPKAINDLNCQLEIGIDKTNPRHLQLVLKLKILSPKDKTATYTGEIHAVGIFRVHNNFPQEKAQGLVETHGASLLFAAIREILLLITSRGPWPPVALASFSFIKPKEEPQTQIAEKAEDAVNQ